MAPKLYMLNGSPPSRAVLMTAKELGVELDLKVCNLMAGEQMSEEFMKRNPAHTVPTLDDDGFIVWESAAIMAYLVGKYGKDDSLYPKDLKKRATVDQMLHFSNASFIKFMVVTREVLFYQKKKAVLSQQHIDTVFDCIGTLDKLIGNHRYVTGDQLTIADFSFIAWIETWDIPFPIDAAKYPNVTAWRRRMQNLPVFELNHEGLQMFRGLWESRE